MALQLNTTYSALHTSPVTRQSLPNAIAKAANPASELHQARLTLSAAAQHLPDTRARATKAEDTRDFTGMTPTQMRETARELFKNGEIDLDQLFLLENMGVPLGKAGPNGEFIALTQEERAMFENAPVDYLTQLSSTIRFLEETGYAMDPLSGYETKKDLLSTLTHLQRV